MVCLDELCMSLLDMSGDADVQGQDRENCQPGSEKKIQGSGNGIIVVRIWTNYG